MIMLYYFLKKIYTNKLTLLLRTIILAIGAFLVALFLTLGYNASDMLSSLFDKYPNYTIICAQNDNSSTNDLLKMEGDELLASARSDGELLQWIDGKHVEIPVTEYHSKSDPVYFSKNLIVGSSEPLGKSVWIGNSVLDDLGFVPQEVLGKNAVLINAGVHTIVGVFDDSDNIVSAQCIVYTDEDFSPQMYYIDALSVDKVEALADDLTTANYTVFSHLGEIKAIQSYVRMTEYAVFFLSLLIIAASSVILYSSLKASIEEMYTYIALLKAIGYTNKHCAFYVFTEALIIYLCSTVIHVLLYIFGVQMIMNILVAEGVHSLFGFSIMELFVIRLDAFGLSIAISIAALMIVSLFCARFISKKQVYEIFFEGNQ